MKFTRTFGWIAMAVAALFISAFALAGVPVDPAHATLGAIPAVGALGLVVNKGTLDDIFKNIKTTFNKAFDAAPSLWEKVAMRVPSTGSENNYKWLANFPRMRKWIGDKVVKALEGFSYTIVNDDFEATVEVDRNDIEDDNLGIIGPQAQMAAFSAKQLPDEIVFELVNNGFASLCYDKQFFFDTDHPVLVAGVVTSVSNKGTAALSISTLALAQVSYGAGRTAMKKFKDDEGRPLNLSPNILLVPPALEDIARALLTNDRLEDGKPNPYKGTAELVVSGHLTSDTAWFLLDTKMPVKPFIYQERKAPVMVSQTNMDADDVFSRKKYKYGAEARAAGGYGFWQMAWGSTGAG